MIHRCRVPGLRKLALGGRRGASIVEFAFVAPVMFLIVFGIIELGRALMVVELVTGAARAGARTGILPGKISSDVATTANNYLNAVGIANNAVTISVNNVVIGQGTDPLTGATPGSEVTVKVVASATQVTWMPAAIFPTGNLAGQFSMRRQ